MNSIQNTYPNLQPISTNLSPATVQPGDEASFKSFLLDSIQEVNTMQHDADQAVEALMTGTGEADPAEVLTAVQKADMAFRLMLQMRNKMMQVYQEVRDIRI
mgnify:CR=1 FL=1